MAKQKPKSPKKEKTDKHPGGRPLLFKSVKELQAAIDAYFESCWEEQWTRQLKVEYRKYQAQPKLLPSLPQDFWEWVPVTDHAGNVIKHQVRPYTITALAHALGTSRETLINYESRDEFFDTIKNAKRKCHAYAEEQLFTPKIAAGVIFNLKNNYGYKDKIDVTSDDKPLPAGNVTVNNINTLSNDELIRLAQGGAGGTSA